MSEVGTEEVEEQTIAEGDVGEMPEEVLEDGTEGEEEVDPNDAIIEAFNVAIASEEALEEDDIKLSMIGAGATFKNVTRLYNQYMVLAGLAISKEDKVAHVAEALEGLEFEDEAGYDLAVVALMDEEKNINERSAGALLRAYAKKNTLEIYKKPKAEGTGRVGFASTYYDFLVANPYVVEAEAKAYIMNPKNSENVRRHESHYMNLWKLTNRIMVTLTEPKSADEPEVAEAGEDGTEVTT